MFAKRFTQAQILCGLRIFWREETGGNDSFDAGTRIDHHLESEGISEEIDITEILHDIEQFFRFSCRLEEWQSYFGWDTKDPEEWERKYAPQFTFGRLADFIRERVEAISLEPLTLLGKPCLTAGIFRGLERLAEQINPKTPRFAPHTPIRECLCGTRLHQFWNRLRWIVEEQIPPAPRLPLSMRGFMHSLAFKFGIGLLIALWRRNLQGLLIGVLLTFLLLIPVGWLISFINSRINPLPKGIETFGDLARFLAAATADKQPERT
ncbi:MAG TPA: hypothetical protein VN688_19345 [Gemmataceae bacterium]|nr:hypothetical protein [Gemmataceae bacterium]